MRRPAIITRVPWRARASASPRPIPEPPPVIKQRLLGNVMAPVQRFVGDSQAPAGRFGVILSGFIRSSKSLLRTEGFGVLIERRVERDPDSDCRVWHLESGIDVTPELEGEE